MIIQPANRMCTFGEINIQIAQQVNIMGTHKLRYHVEGFVDHKITVGCMSSEFRVESSKLVTIIRQSFDQVSKKSENDQ